MKRALMLLYVLLVPAGAGAQEAGGTWPGLDTSKLPTVHVVDDSGAETTGRLLRLNPDSVVLLVDGAERRVEAERVRRIQRRGDSLRNGALIGAAAGVVLGILGAAISDCPSIIDDGCPGARAAIFLTSAGMYTAAGTAIDALVVGRTTLYERGTGTASRGRRSASLPRGGAMLSASVRF